MSATVSTLGVKAPVIRLVAVIGGAMLTLAIVIAIALAASAAGSPANDSAAGFDPGAALQSHVLRENAPLAAGRFSSDSNAILFEHVLRENRVD